LNSWNILYERYALVCRKGKCGYGDYDVLVDLSGLKIFTCLLAWLKIVHTVDLARID
jgi:hypothetical protein